MFPRRFLRSERVWRLSGLSWPTAVLATRGRLQGPLEYIAASRRQMTQILPWIHRDARIVEYGCGLGGNLVAIHSMVRQGLGVDVNQRYLRLAKRLAERVGARNLEFQVVSGRGWNVSGRVDTAFSVGVFERLDGQTVRAALSMIRGCLAAGGVGIFSFLSPRALSSSMVNLLGRDAYTTWTRSQIAAVVDEAGLELLELRAWLSLNPADPSVADLAVVRRGS